ncbi:hypothetical protein WJX72_004647 [[Myrmecia] bisecta]|uniref:Uncharacterized protein n=1 Tax=[Myrmecia] bisecta TaxID=41462 RepID=A0AAW1Q716_9CHLO
MDYASIQWIASHERDVTRMHYLTLANDAIHKVGGFGPDWATQHTLGRAADCSALKQLLLPRLTAMNAAVQEDHRLHPMLPTLLALDWLLEVWLQDLPLKLGQHGDQYRGMLPAAVRAVERHPSWPDFRKRVLDETPHFAVLTSRWLPLTWGAWL